MQIDDVKLKEIEDFSYRYLRINEIALVTGVELDLFKEEGHAVYMAFHKGRLIRKAEYNEKVIQLSNQLSSPAMALEKALAEDLLSREHTVMQNIKVPLNQNQFDALVSYVYNTGGSSTLYNLINTKAVEAKIKFWFEDKYVTGGGVKLAGLVRRRKAESDLYFN